MIEQVVPWEQRRARFHHDQLKNEFLNRFGAFFLRLDHASPNREYLQSFVESDFTRWPELSARARELLATFEAEMTPATRFQSGVLTRLSPSDAAWARQIVHAIWKQRLGVDDLLQSLTAALDDADRAWSGVNARLGTASIEALRALRAEWQAFYDDCVRLSEAFSRLPHRIPFS